MMIFLNMLNINSTEISIRKDCLYKLYKGIGQNLKLSKIALRLEVLLC